MSFLMLFDHFYEMHGHRISTDPVSEHLLGGCPRMAIFPNFYVPAERDLRFASTGSNYNPRNTNLGASPQLECWNDGTLE